MSKNNRISPKRKWVLPLSIIGAVVVALVIIFLIFGFPPWGEGAGTPATTIATTSLSGGEPSEQKKPGATSADVYIHSITAATGLYLEGGAYEELENVLAILVENKSDEFMDVATITYDLGDTEAEFVINGLPPGELTWVKERNRLTYTSDMNFDDGPSDYSVSFDPDAIMETDDVTVTYENEVLVAKNNTDKTLKNVCIYYRNIGSDGCFQSGTAYYIAFGDLEAGETSEEKQSAFFADNSKIVKYSYQTAE